MIHVEQLHKSFGENHVLRGVNLDVAEGSITVILGRSGGGKSVLLKHLIGLATPDSGRVVVDGIDLASQTRQQQLRMRTRFGLVFQLAALFDSMTVFENVGFPLKERRPDLSAAEREKRVLAMLSSLDLGDAIERLPAELSGGMRKRVGLARALILEPSIVLYDEPTTGLDPITTASVDAMIIAAKRAHGVTSVVISHNISSAFSVGDQIAFLHEGQIVEVGSPASFRRPKHPATREFLDAWLGEHANQSDNASWR